MGTTEVKGINTRSDGSPGGYRQLAETVQTVCSFVACTTKSV